MEEKPLKLVVVGRYANEFEAHLARALLEEAGIDCIVNEGTLTRVYGLRLPAGDWATLQVREEDAEKASRLLQEHAQSQRIEEDSDADDAE